MLLKKLTSSLLVSVLMLVSCDYETSYESRGEEEQEHSNCGFDDGSHSATVEYDNPETGYSQTYTLEVEVENCEVVQIDFPGGGWLDSDHITPAEIDESGNCIIEGEDGKTYEIQIDD